MESNILEQLKKEYPMISEEAANALSTFFQGISNGEKREISTVDTAVRNFLTILNNDYGRAAQNASIISENNAKRAVVQQFKQTLSEELKKRNVPEYFYRAALDIDDENADVATAATAIQTQYDAFCQQQNNASLDGSLRPQVGQKMNEASSAVENYIRSLRSDSPLSGKLKR